MATGLQVWDASGNLIFDTSLQTTCVLGSGTTGTTAGSLTDTRIGSRNGWVIMTSGDSKINTPVFTFSANTVSWTFPDNTDSIAAEWSNGSISFVYGVY